MSKTLLITGSTDGIGLETARRLVADGHHVLLHGRNADKLARVEAELSALGTVESYSADLADFAEVEALADAVAERHDRLDVLINNAGVYSTAHPVTADGLDVRFAVNTVAPYLLTRRLLPLLASDGRVVNLSSAAQAPVDLDALAGRARLGDGPAYAQSKLALTAWSRHLAGELGPDGPVVVSVNPGSLLGTKMVKEAFGMAGKDVGIGADILVRAALSEEFAAASGRYFDNDAGRFAPPHPDALDGQKAQAIVRAIEAVLAAHGAGRSGAPATAAS
ncbi:SDR family NAD(P)-dependent oxidoreductase [Rubrivirga sp. IMCC45206]|uniref:SDR family NAD(P)-dependent oxidoreductase n=1 Tax=Rubrivirga sp. IMCC45206 TaxID=3391614 RepID=UPI00398F93BC